MLIAKPFEQGRFSVILGPVHSDKNSVVKSFLDGAVDSGYSQDGNIKVFRHPADDPNPERIGKHSVELTEQVDKIFDGILPQTRTVIIAGASHYQDRKIVDLADAIIRSNRELYISGLNLDALGEPHGFMPELIALADKIILTKALCSFPTCQSMEATRSKDVGEGKYQALCTHHYHFDSPPISKEGAGFLKMNVGPMYAGKTTGWASDLKKVIEKGWEYVVFKYLHDNHSGEAQKKIFDMGEVTLHEGENIKAVSIKTGKDVEEYLSQYPKIRQIFLNEAQFISGLYNTLFKLMPRGYKFDVDGLLRDFKRKKFGEIANAVCLADEVNSYYAICKQCSHPATNNQRMKRVGDQVMPAHIDDPIEAIGGKDDGRVKYYYEPRCIAEWVLDGEPKLVYELPKFSWK